MRNTQQVIERDLQKAARHYIRNDSTAQNEFVRKAISHLSYSWNVGEAVRDADLVIEAIYENLKAKQQLFIEVEKVKQSLNCVIITTTTITYCN